MSVSVRTVPPPVCAGIEQFIIEGCEMTLDPPPLTALHWLWVHVLDLRPKD